MRNEELTAHLLLELQFLGLAGSSGPSHVTCSSCKLVFIVKYI